MLKRTNFHLVFKWNYENFSKDKLCGNIFILEKAYLIEIQIFHFKLSFCYSVNLNFGFSNFHKWVEFNFNFSTLMIYVIHDVQFDKELSGIYSGNNKIKTFLMHEYLMAKIQIIWFYLLNLTTILFKMFSQGII